MIAKGFIPFSGAKVFAIMEMPQENAVSLSSPGGNE